MDQYQPAIEKILTLWACHNGRVDAAALERYADRMALAAERCADPHRAAELAMMAYLHRAAVEKVRREQPVRRRRWPARSR